MLQELKNKIVDWADDRGLIWGSPTNQMLKLLEEAGELAAGMVKNKPEQIEDSIGDIFVVLVILAEQQGLGIEDCAARAWEEIKDRKGRMINGVFVKESDLREDERC